jgi:hypothetical protein
MTKQSGVCFLFYILVGVCSVCCHAQSTRTTWHLRLQTEQRNLTASVQSVLMTCLWQNRENVIHLSPYLQDCTSRETRVKCIASYTAWLMDTYHSNSALTSLTLPLGYTNRSATRQVRVASAAKALRCLDTVRSASTDRRQQLMWDIRQCPDRSGFDLDCTAMTEQLETESHWQATDHLLPDDGVYNVPLPFSLFHFLVFSVTPDVNRTRFCDQWELQQFPHCTSVASTSNSQIDEFCALSYPTNSTLHTITVLDATNSASDTSNASQSNASKPSFLTLSACHQEIVSVLPSSAQPVIISIPFIDQNNAQQSRYGVFGVAAKGMNAVQTGHRPLNVYVSANGSDWRNRLTWGEIANITIPRQCPPLPHTIVSANTSASWWFDGLSQAMVCVASLAASGIRPRVATIPFSSTFTAYGLLKTGLTRGGPGVKENELSLALRNNCSLPDTSEVSAIVESMLFSHSEVTQFVRVPRLDEHQVKVCALAVLSAGVQVASVPTGSLDLTLQGWLTVRIPEESLARTKDFFDWTLEETLVYSCLSPHKVLPLWSAGTTQYLAVLGRNILPYNLPDWEACVPDTWRVSYSSDWVQITHKPNEDDSWLFFSPQMGSPWLRLQGGRIVQYLHSHSFISTNTGNVQPCPVLNHGNNDTFETLLATEIIKSINAAPSPWPGLVVEDHLQTVLWGELILCYKCIMSSAQKLLSPTLFQLFSNWWKTDPSSGFMNQNEAAVNVLGDEYYFYGTQTELQTAEHNLPWCGIHIPWIDNTTRSISHISRNQHELNVELLMQSQSRTQQAIMPCYRADQLIVGSFYSSTQSEHTEHTELSELGEHANKGEFPLVVVLLIIIVALVVILLAIVLIVRQSYKKQKTISVK